MTHSDLIDIGYKWVMKRCAFGFKDLKTQNQEIPDVIGFISNWSFVLEAKVSRADFKKDSLKDFRINPDYGMGDFRFFIAPENLITPEELKFKMWGLIEVDKKRKPKVIYNPYGKGNIYCNWKKHNKNERAERQMMYSALRRLEENKVITKYL